MAIDIVGHLIIPRHIHRRQFDDLPEHVKGRAYFEDHGDTDHTGYYFDNQKQQKTPTEFLCIDGEDRWYILHYSSRLQRYQATDESILPIQNPFTGYWHIDEPDHPDYVIPAQQPEPVEEYLAGGLHHTTTLEGPQSQLSPTHLVC